MILAVLVLAALLAYVLWDRSKERQEWTKERRLLLTRIQSPHTVSPEIDEDAPTPEAVNPESDADYWAARGIAVDGSRLS